MYKTYKHVVLGGTFDILHLGHKKLLTSAFKIGQNVTVGVTADSFSPKQNQILAQNHSLRKKVLLNFLKEKNLAHRAQILLINDFYGPTLSKKLYDALIVSRLTLNNALKINKKRKQIGLSKLVIIKVPLANAYDGRPISSTRIKNGEIDQFGRSYINLLSKIAGKRLPDNIRNKLKQPFGQIVKANNSLAGKVNIITIGDISTQSLNSLNLQKKLSVVDFSTARKRIFNSLVDLGFDTNNPTAIIKNTSGQISRALISGMSKRLRSKNQNEVILVDGEEDLAAICAVLLSPIPSTVFYGQPNRGLVMIEVDIEAKNRLCKLLKLSR